MKWFSKNLRTIFLPLIFRKQYKMPSIPPRIFIREKIKYCNFNENGLNKF